jgi:hypothetical protein
MLMMGSARDFFAFLCVAEVFLCLTPILVI